MKRPSLSHFVFVIAVMSIGNAVVKGQALNLTGKHVCSSAGKNLMLFTINIEETNGNAVTTVRAVNANDDEITTCSMTLQSSTYTVKSVVNLETNTENNACGMRTSMVKGQYHYTWHFRGVRFNRGFVINATCSKDDFKDGVTTLAKFNITRLLLTASNPASVTGPNSFATDSMLTLTAVIYPDGLNTPAALKNAKGFYLRNCYSGTDEAVQENRQLMIDGDGCPISGTTYAPSNPPQKRPGSGTSPLIVDASFIRSTKVNDESRVYIECSVAICTLENECDNRCDAHNNNIPIDSEVFTPVTLDTNFYVQDVPATAFKATLVGQTAPLEYINLNGNSVIQLVGTFSPTGVDSPNGAFRSAKGFYLHSCIYAENSRFQQSTLFVNQAGCFISGTKLSAESEFKLTSSDNNQYTITSGPINLRSDISHLRLWSRCTLGKCKVDGHNYCKNMRCGATTNDPNNAQDNIGTDVEITFAILNSTNQQTRTLQVGGDGDIFGDDATVIVGTPVPFGATVIPNDQDGSNDVFNNAKGAYVHSCYVTKFENPTEKIYFINGTGCPIESDYTPSERCTLDNTFPGVPPFVISCGTFVPPETGNLTHHCLVGACRTANNPVCSDRCGAGALTADSNADDLPISDGGFSSQTYVRDPDVIDDRRTAVRANQVVAIVIGVTVAVPLAVLGIVGIITYCIVNAQRPK